MANEFDDLDDNQDNPMAQLRKKYDEAIKELKAVQKAQSADATELAQIKAERQREQATATFEAVGLNPGYAEWYLSTGGSDLSPEAVAAWATERGLSGTPKRAAEESVDEGIAVAMRSAVNPRFVPVAGQPVPEKKMPLDEWKELRDTNRSYADSLLAQDMVDLGPVTATESGAQGQLLSYPRKRS